MTFTTETAMHWTAVGFYIVGAVVFAYATLFNHPAKSRWAFWVTALGLVPHSVALILRWIDVGHGPYMLKYEVLSSNSWIVVVMLLLFVRLRSNWAPLALVVLPAAILMIGFGVFSNPQARDLPPTLRSLWLVFHVFFNKLAVGAFLLSLSSAVILLRKLKGDSGRLLDRLPAADVLEAYTVRFIGFGFVFWSTTIVAGAVWANQSWGRYWGWDPIETWSLVTWLCYGTVLHLRLFFKIKTKATAWATIGCFVVAVLTVFIFPFLIPSMHSAYFM